MSQKQQRILPYAAFNDWFSYRIGKCLLRGTNWGLRVVPEGLCVVLYAAVMRSGLQPSVCVGQCVFSLGRLYWWRKRWARHAARVGELTDLYQMLKQNRTERHGLRDPSVGGSVRVKAVLSWLLNWK